MYSFLYRYVYQQFSSLTNYFWLTLYLQSILNCHVIYDEGDSELNSLQEKMRAFADIFVSRKVTKLLIPSIQAFWDTWRKVWSLFILTSDKTESLCSAGHLKQRLINKQEFSLPI